MIAPGGRRSAFTIPEVVVAFLILSMIFIMVFELLSLVVGPRKASATQKTAESFLRQDSRLAFQKLMDRIEEGIEILSPGPGESGPELLFLDLLNHRVRLAVDDRGVLTSFRVQGEASQAETRTESQASPAGESVALTRPVRIPGCDRALFKVSSPTLVTALLTLRDNQKTGTLAATVRLRNPRLVDE